MTAVVKGDMTKSVQSFGLREERNIYICRFVKINLHLMSLKVLGSISPPVDSTATACLLKETFLSFLSFFPG